MVTFPEVPLGILLFCVCVIAIGAVQVGRPACPPPATHVSSCSTRTRVGRGALATAGAGQTVAGTGCPPWATAESLEMRGAHARGG